MNRINKIFNIIRNIFGAVFILLGILGAIFSSFMAGFFIVYFSGGSEDWAGSYYLKIQIVFSKKQKTFKNGLKRTFSYVII